MVKEKPKRKRLYRQGHSSTCPRLWKPSAICVCEHKRLEAKLEAKAGRTE